MCLRLSKRIWINVKVLGRVRSTYQQVAVTAEYSRPVKKKAEV